MAFPTQAQIDRFFSIFHDSNHVKLQEACRDAEQAFHANPELVKVRRARISPTDPNDPIAVEAAKAATKNDPTPSFLFNEGRLFALARNGAIGEGSFGRVKLLLEVLKNPDTGEYHYGQVYIAKIERTNTAHQMSELEFTRKVGHSVGEKKERDVVDKIDRKGNKYDKKYYSIQIFLGDSLKSFVKTLPPKSPERLSLAIKLCEAVAELHETHQIAHHDIKLANFTIDPEGHIHPIDFGLSTKLSELGSLQGTVPYMLGAEDLTLIGGRYSFIIEDIIDYARRTPPVLTSEEKDLLALRRTLLLQRSAKLACPNEIALFTQELFDTFPSETRGLLYSDTFKQACTKVDPRMLAAQFAVILHLHDIHPEILNHMAYFLKTCPRTVLNDILAIHHHKTLSLIEKSDQLKQLISKAINDEIQKLPKQILSLSKQSQSDLEADMKSLLAKPLIMAFNDLNDRVKEAAQKELQAMNQTPDGTKNTFVDFKAAVSAIQPDEPKSDLNPPKNTS
jgi:serine/threonine protein kinase